MLRFLEKERIHIQIDYVKRHILQAYAEGRDLAAGALQVRISFDRLEEFLNLFPHVQSSNWLNDTFNALRSQKGDYGYFIRQDNELVFCNLIPLRPNLQSKKILKLISTTCERQFTRTRPALLWLHLQGLSPEYVYLDPAKSPDIFWKLARHTFRNERRDHVSSLVISSDTDLDLTSTSIRGKAVRTMASSGNVNGFSNPQCRFGDIRVFVPLFSK